MAELERLYGVDPDAIEKLKAEGISSIEEFYDLAKYADSRAELSEKIGVEPFKLEEWSSIAGNILLMMDCAWE